MEAGKVVFFWLMSEKRDILRNAIGFVAVKEIRIK